MTQLVELNQEKHANLKVKKNSALHIAKSQHAINLRVVELSKAACNFPLFFTRVDETGDLALSAMTSFEPGTNLFVQKGQWLSTYFPSTMQTFPIFLMQKEGGEKNYTLGIEESNSAFSETEGEALFDEKGAASIYLSQMKAILEANISDIVHSFQFLNTVNEYDLLKALDLKVHYVDGTINVLKGLYTIDEDTLKDLPKEDFLKLNERGYLPPIYSMLFSLYQLNALIKMHNTVEHSSKISQVKMEVSKDNT